MSTSVLPQLLEVDSKLLAQESSLEAQLIALQEKRKGIQTVIAMFETGDAPTNDSLAASVGTAETASEAKSKQAKSKQAKSKQAKTDKTTSAEPESTVSKTSKASKTKKTKDSTAQPSTKTKTRKVKASQGRPAKAKSGKAESASAAKKASAKRSGRTANWQKYIQDTYSEAALPDVIVGVLKAQPNSIFKIADVMNTVFKEDMPKTHFLKARNRVSNILSAGARDGEWYRGRGGTYSASEKAIKAVG